MSQSFFGNASSRGTAPAVGGNASVPTVRTVSALPGVPARRDAARRASRPPQEAASGQATRVYEGEQALTAGIAAMAALGWRVASQSSFQPHSGVGRTVALGFIGAALIKPPVSSQSGA